MCTLLKQQDSSLTYLEQVRQHMSRLPGIDPTGRTLLLTGYPNVGKSSAMNLLTRADVEVQPYAFTTKSLYVGHMDYKYVRWQVSQPARAAARQAGQRGHTTTQAGRTASARPPAPPQHPRRRHSARHFIAAPAARAAACLAPAP